jgi:hypothetical protein
MSLKRKKDGKIINTGKIGTDKWWRAESVWGRGGIVHTILRLQSSQNISVGKALELLDALINRRSEGIPEAPWDNWADTLEEFAAEPMKPTFRVVCDETNNTPSDIKNRLVKADVYFTGMNTFCPQCGPKCKVDAEGCCVSCGCTAVGPEVEGMACEKDHMQDQIIMLTAEVERWKALAMRGADKQHKEQIDNGT